MLYYIDFENVKSAGMTGIERLTENDRVFIFYSEENCRVTFSLLKELLCTKAKLEFFEVTIVSQNSLDFQLSTKLGYDAAKYPAEKFVIVSIDKGFRPVVAFWQKRGIDIEQQVCIHQGRTGAGRNKSPKDRILSSYPEERGKINEILSSYETKEEIHNALMCEYGSPKAGHIYNSLKPLLKSIIQKQESAVPEKQIEASEPENAPVPEEAPNPAETKKRGRPRKHKIPVLSDLIPQYADDMQRVEEIIGRYKTKLGISKALTREYDEGKGEKIYSLITPLIKDKKGKDAGTNGS